MTHYKAGERTEGQAKKTGGTSGGCSNRKIFRLTACNEAGSGQVRRTPRATRRLRAPARVKAVMERMSCGKNQTAPVLRALRLSRSTAFLPACERQKLAVRLMS